MNREELWEFCWRCYEGTAIKINPPMTYQQQARLVLPSLSVLAQSLGFDNPGWGIRTTKAIN